MIVMNNCIIDIGTISISLSVGASGKMYMKAPLLNPDNVKIESGACSEINIK